MRSGWTLGSKQAQNYIRRSGVSLKPLAKKVFNNNILKVQEENIILKERLDKLEKYHNGMKDMLERGLKYPHGFIMATSHQLSKEGLARQQEILNKSSR